jgi:predicted RNA-binding protein
MTIGSSALEEVMESSSTSFGTETKKVTITLVAYARLEYTEVIDVPIEFDEAVFDEMATIAASQAIGSKEHFTDSGHWEIDDEKVKLYEPA